MSNISNLTAANSGTMIAFKKDDKWVVGLADAASVQCLTIHSVVSEEETKYFCKFEYPQERTIAWIPCNGNQLTMPLQTKHMPDALVETVMEYYQNLQLLHLPTVFKSLANAHQFSERAFHENLVYAAYYSAFAAGAELQVDTRELNPPNSSSVFSRTFSIVRKDKRPIPKIYFNDTAPFFSNKPLDFLLYVHQYLAEQECVFVSRDAWVLTKDLIEYHVLDLKK